MDRTSEPAVPRYLAVARDIEADIRKGRLVPGDRLPSERDIARDRQISRMTARQAVQHLTRRGLLEAQIGRGTFVRASAIQQELATLTGFSEEMAKKGRETSSIVIEAATHEADPATSLALGLTHGGLVHKLTRVRLVDGAPVANEISAQVGNRAPAFSTAQIFPGNRPMRGCGRNTASSPRPLNRPLKPLPPTWKPLIV
jgi:GntR family transcriptional regulator